MAQYLLLFRGGDVKEAGFTPAEAEDYYAGWGRWAESIHREGIWLGGHPLEDEGRVLGPSPLAITDGPFAETKEVLGGYIMIEAGDFDAAVKIAQDCPIFRVHGRVEVRRALESPICANAEASAAQMKSSA